MKGYDVNFNPAVAGTNYVTGLQKTSNTGASETIKFGTDNKIANLPKTTLSSSTLKALKAFDGTVTQRMADDVLATPYISLNFNA